MTAPEAPREIETKFRLGDRADFESRLRALGGTAGPTEFESNVLLDDKEGSLLASGQALRVRDAAGRGVLTFKGKATLDRGLKSRVELETRIAQREVVEQIFAELGFAPVFRYEKRRTTWRFSDPGLPLVVVDETPIGLFAEIEGEEPAVRALAVRLAIPEDQMIAASYPVLYQEARTRNPALAVDMTFMKLDPLPDPAAA
ncbi:MAG: class IV adenylate cyclase [Thermoanaerobaculia bacterium]